VAKGGFVRGGPILSSAPAGIDQALWDIAGTSLGVPVSRLFGGAVRDRVRVYSWIGGDDPAGAAAAVAGSSSYRGSSGGRWTPERPGSRTDSWG
jgi:galactonate dehydratase